MEIIGGTRINGYPDYAVTTSGQVLSYKRSKEGVVLRSQVLSKGYLGVRLYNEEGGKTLKVHRLVAEAFLENPDNLPQVNHKNGDKTDNSVPNLEYCDNAYNHDHAVRTGLWKPQPLKYKDSIEDMKRLKGKGLSTRAIAKELGIPKSTVAKYLA